MASDWIGSAVLLLVDTSWRLAALPALVWLVLAAARVRSSAVRHRAWTATLGAMLLMPVLPAVVPSVAVPIPPIASLADTHGAAFVARDSSPRTGAETGVSPTIPAEPIAAQDETRSMNLRQRATTISRAWQGALLLYGAGVFVLAIRLILGWRAADRLVRTAVPIDVPGLRGTFESPAVATPMTVGVFAPRILLPAARRTWPDATLRAVLAHERAHVERRDPIVAFGARVNRCLFWFHPAAWWIERRLAADAEHACDDAAVRVVGQSRDYAEVLLEMAAVVRQNRGRVLRHALGVDGSGLLGRRIDRILRGEGAGEVSRWRKLAVGAGCAAAVVAVVACKQHTAAAPLRENPDVARRLAEQEAEQDLSRRAAAMNAADLDALETSLKQNPNDLERWKTLKAFYTASGQEVLGWNAMIVRRRPHVVYLVEHMAEHPIAIWRVTPAGDPSGYAAAAAAWRARAARGDVSAQILGNAAAFFTGTENAEAERLLLRAREMDRDARAVRGTSAPPDYWSLMLGRFYGESILGPRSQHDGRPTTAFESDAYAKYAYTRMMASEDAAMVAAAGAAILRGSYFDAAREALGRQLVDRALHLDPSNAQAKQVRLAIEQNDRSRRLREKQAQLAGLGEKLQRDERLTPEDQDRLRARAVEAAASLPEPERLIALVEVSEIQYMSAENLQSARKDEAGARIAWEQSKRAATEALSLAPKFRDRPEHGAVVYRATVALALHALREGDRERSVRLMGEAGRAPHSELLASQHSFGLWLRLVNYLLKEGERSSVAEFLQKSAGLMILDRDRLLKDAASIRAGEMPVAYQTAMSR